MDEVLADEILTDELLTEECTKLLADWNDTDCSTAQISRNPPKRVSPQPQIFFFSLEASSTHLEICSFTI